MEHHYPIIPVFRWKMDSGDATLQAVSQGLFSKILRRQGAVEDDAREDERFRQLAGDVAIDPEWEFDGRAGICCLGRRLC